jgi:membrane associated rhomboid family serine protease
MRNMQVPVVARAIVAICVVVWVAELATRTSQSSVLGHGILYAPYIADGEWWRIITAGFLHDNRLPMGLLHIGFNMYMLYYLGTMLEPTLGRTRFAVAFFVSLLGGSLGALLLSPDKAVVGAAGAGVGGKGGGRLGRGARGGPPG